MSDSTKANHGTAPSDGYVDIKWGDVDEEPPPPQNPQPDRQADKPPPDKPPPGPSDNEDVPAARVRPSRYITTTEDDKDSGFEKIAVFLSLFFVIITFPLSIFLCLIVVKEYHRVLIFRLGRVRKGVRGPGLVWTLPCIDAFVKVDLRTFATEVPSQDILTRDSVTISVDAVLYYCIKDPMDALIQVDDAKEATVLIAQTTLRHIVGAKPLHTLLTSRETLSKEIQLAVDEITERWGVRVERVDVMDISLPRSLQRSLASEAEAVREARAKIISAEGERNASQALKEASDVMSQNKITLQLRHLQILTAIAAEHNCTIIFPFPMEVMTAFGMAEGSSKGKPKPDGKDGGGKPPPTDFPQFGDFTPKVIITEPPNLPEDLRFGESGEEPETSNQQKRDEAEIDSKINEEPELIDEKKADEPESIQLRTAAENDIKSSNDNGDVIDTKSSNDNGAVNDTKSSNDNDIKNSNDNERKVEDSESIPARKGDVNESESESIQARKGDVNDSSNFTTMPARLTRLISPHFRRSHARTGIESESETDPPPAIRAKPAADRQRKPQAKNEFSYYTIIPEKKAEPDTRIQASSPPTNHSTTPPPPPPNPPPPTPPSTTSAPPWSPWDVY